MKRIIAIAALALSTVGLSGCFFFPPTTDYRNDPVCHIVPDKAAPPHEVCN